MPTLWDPGCQKHPYWLQPWTILVHGAMVVDSSVRAVDAVWFFQPLDTSGGVYTLLLVSWMQAVLVSTVWAPDLFGRTRRFWGSDSLSSQNLSPPPENFSHFSGGCERLSPDLLGQARRFWGSDYFITVISLLVFVVFYSHEAWWVWTTGSQITRRSVSSTIDSRVAMAQCYSFRWNMAHLVLFPAPSPSFVAVCTDS